MANGIWTLFVLANYIESKVLRIDNHDNVGKSVRFSLWNWADALWAQCNGGSSFLACSLMCHSFRSQRSLQHHTALRTVLLSVDNAHREPPHGHWGKYLCTYWGGTKNSHWDLDCGTFLKKKIKINVFSFFLPNSLFDYCCQVNVCN